MSRSPRKHQDADSTRLALRHFREAAEAGRIQIHPRVHDRAGELDLCMGNIAAAVRAAAREIALADKEPVSDPWDPPGHAFVWDSAYFGRSVYLKFRLEGRRPTVVVYSLHPPDY